MSSFMFIRKLIFFFFGDNSNSNDDRKYLLVILDVRYPTKHVIYYVIT